MPKRDPPAPGRPTLAEDERSAAAPGTQLYGGRYEVEAELGRGGMGRVLRARDTKLGRRVALKILTPGAHSEAQLRRFEQEARAASALNHPNILAVYDVGEQAGEPYIVSELLDGETVRAVLAEGPLAPAEALDLGLQLAEGLATAHDHGVVHRDLKPENLFLTNEGRLKILDFGLAKLTRSAADAAGGFRTETGAILGTISYMSPEQVRGLPADQRSDIFSFGAVLHEMLAGSPPFRRDTDVATAWAIVNEAPPPLPAGTPAGLAHLVACCLRKDPAERYENARALLRELREHDGRPRRRLPRNSSLFIALAVALLAGATLFMKRMLPTRTELPIESLAVLPLQNLSGDPAQEYLADGMTEELTTELAQISPLRVISRTSVMQYKGTKKPLPQIARELNVDAVVEGSVQRSGDRVRITAQLIHAPTDRRLWTRSYERELREVLSLENEVAQAISKEVGSKLSSQQQMHVSASATRVVSPDAYEAYLRGSSHLDSGDLQKANDYFTQAIKLDPGYAPPYVKLATSYYFQAFFNLLPPNVAFPKMRDAATKALQIDEAFPEAHGVLALVHLHYDWDWAEAEREFKRALQLNPNQADIRHEYSHFLMTMGRMEESVSESKRAIQLDPMDTILTACVCWHRYSAREYHVSMEQALKSVQTDPNLDWTHIILGWDYEQLGKFQEAISEFQKAVTLSGGNSFSRAALGHAFAAAGQREEALGILASLEKPSQHVYVSPFDIALIHTALGDKEKAFEWLQRAYEERSCFLIYLKWEPRLDPLRSDPRFQHLQHQVGLPG
jgi:serine/threonine protein kinase/Tfp pilus assembly protein PilF